MRNPSGQPPAHGIARCPSPSPIVGSKPWSCVVLERLRVQNYRALRSFEIERLAPINLIGGRNGSGKTTLLEALFLVLGSHQPEIMLNRYVTRMENIDAAPPLLVPVSSSPEPYWAALFSDYNPSLQIRIEVHDSQCGPVSATVSRDDSASVQVPLQSVSHRPSSDRLSQPRLLIESVGPGDLRRTRAATLTATGIEISSGPEQPIPIAAVIESPAISQGIEHAQRLGTLRRHKQHDVLVRALQAVEPRIIGIEDSTSTGFPSIWADVGSGELVPLSTLGGGAMHVARLVLSMSAAQGGVALIDEVESGIHHSSLVDVWKSLDLAAQQFQTQIIATTHSYECIKAMQQALGADRAQYIRLDRTNGSTTHVSYAPDALDAAIEFELEVR